MTATITYAKVFHKTVKSTATPLEVLRNLGADDSTTNPFLLDSGRGFSETGRYSFLGVNPIAVFTCSEGAARLEHLSEFSQNEQEDFTGNPFDILKEVLSRFSWDNTSGSTSENLPPFFGGWTGFFSYELGRYIERLPDTVVHDSDWPELRLCFYPRILCHDNEADTWTAFSLAQKSESFEQHSLVFDKLLSAVHGTQQITKQVPWRLDALAANFTRESYEAAVARAIEYIYAGDIFQVNLSQRFSAEIDFSKGSGSLDLMANLLDENPAPFSAYLAFEKKAVLSSSPERFIKKTGSRVETRPIKGTFPRGKNREEDERNRELLLSSEKDEAELNMITDLLRNDLGRVCKYGSVYVLENRRLEAYATVFHTVSIIEGIMRTGNSAADTVELLRATLPGGSITGAPKVRAMEIIDELEPTSRELYTGCIGYISVNGDMDLNIVIRTLLLDDNRLTWQAGGGIVADSVPAAEYEETLHKAEGIMRALGLKAKYLTTDTHG